MNGLKTRIWQSSFAKHLGHFYVTHSFSKRIKRLLAKNPQAVLFIDGVSTLGDASLFLASIGDYAKSHPDRKIQIMTSKSHYRLCHYFCPNLKITKKANLWRYLLRLDFDAFFPIEYFELPGRVFSDLYGMIKPSFGNSAFVKWRDERVPFETATMDYYARFRLGLPNSWTPLYPCLNGVCPSLKAQKILADNKPFILFNSVSRTGPKTHQFLQQVAPIITHLLTLGFRLYTNTPKNEAPISGTQSLSCSIEDLFFLSKKASLFISVRSGILDFIVSSGCPIISLLNSNSQNIHYPLSSWKTKDRIDEITVDKLTVDYVNDLLRSETAKH
jgi:hypothetical protein